ncbi:MAG: hypothetical protein WAM22_06825, partial [Nitrososphaeraceae archaeon]
MVIAPPKLPTMVKGMAGVGGAGPDGIHSILSLALVIKFSAQLKLVDSPLPRFFCLSLCSVSVSDSSSWANASCCISCCYGIIENVIT